MDDLKRLPGFDLSPGDGGNGTPLDDVSSGHGFMQGELKDGKSRPTIGGSGPNAVSSDHHSQVTQNESGLVPVPGR